MPRRDDAYAAAAVLDLFGAINRVNGIIRQFPVTDTLAADFDSDFTRLTNHLKRAVTCEVWRENAEGS